MTEVEWLACNRPAAMLFYLQRKMSGRKLTLFACACFRQFWSRLRDRRTRNAIEAAEQVVDGLAPRSALSAAYRDYWDTEGRMLRFGDALQQAAAQAAHWMTAFGSFRVFEAAHTACQISEAGVEPFMLLRDMVGNPFRPVTISSVVLAWNDALVVRLAQVAYEERHIPAGTLDNGRLAVLADALEEAGCTYSDILDHLRGPGFHVRGCWPVDLCLGKT